MAPPAVAPATESNDTSTLKKSLGSDTSANDQKGQKNELQEEVDAESNDDGEHKVVGKGSGINNMATKKSVNLKLIFTGEAKKKKKPRKKKLERSELPCVGLSKL